MLFAVEAEFMNAKHNLEFSDYIFTLFLYLTVDTVTIISKEACGMYDDFEKMQTNTFLPQGFFSLLISKGLLMIWDSCQSQIL